MARIVLGLGSNMGDRAGNLRLAVAALRAVLADMRLSRVLESRAVLPPGAPAGWDMPFLNMAICGHTKLAPAELLKAIKSTEQKLGRISRDVWAPREIDIDILAYGEEYTELNGLQIPHPRLFERDFALIPLAELWPDWKCPTGKYQGQQASAIVADLRFACGEHLRDTGVILDAA